MNWPQVLVLLSDPNIKLSKQKVLNVNLLTTCGKVTFNFCCTCPIKLLGILGLGEKHKKKQRQHTDGQALCLCLLIPSLLILLPESG